MTSPNKTPSVIFGQTGLIDATAALASGKLDCLAVTAHTADALSSAARELIRNLRAVGAKVEFFQPGGVEAALQAANRLLVDIPVEQLTSDDSQREMRLLLVDNAEILDESDIAAIKRVSRALRGSALRTVLFARLDPAIAPNEALEEFLRESVTWRVDETAPLLDLTAASFALRPDLPAAELTIDRVSETAVDDAADTVSREREDVLAELAAERARERGFDATEPAFLRRYARPLGGLALALLLAAGLYFASLATTQDVRARVYDCGVYSDEETLEVVRERIGRTAPTRVLREQDKWRLQVGPFAGEAEAEKRLSQVWAIGTCRVVPVILQEQQQG